MPQGSKLDGVIPTNSRTVKLLFTDSCRLEL
jgi:hypothetical protein